MGQQQLLLLVLGIVSLAIFQPLGFAPWIMGNHDLAEMKAGRMDPDGRGMTDAGRICGIIGVVMLAIPIAILIVVGIAMLFLAIVGAAADAGRDAGPSDAVLLLASYAAEDAALPGLLSGLRRRARQGVLMGCVDTGAVIFARAGLLEARSAAVHPRRSA